MPIIFVRELISVTGFYGASSSQMWVEGWQTSVDVSTGLVSLIGADLGPRLKKKRIPAHIKIWRI